MFMVMAVTPFISDLKSCRYEKGVSNMYVGFLWSLGPFIICSTKPWILGPEGVNRPKDPKFFLC